MQVERKDNSYKLTVSDCDEEFVLEYVPCKCGSCPTYKLSVKKDEKEFEHELWGFQDFDDDKATNVSTMLCLLFEELVVKKKYEHFSYYECAKVIEKKLGIKLNDVLGTFSKNKHDDTLPYQNFWHVCVNIFDAENGKLFWIIEHPSLKDWQLEIVKAFNDEFGEGPYVATW